MNNSEFICKKCGCTDFYTKAKGPHMGAYCCNCHTWLKWLKGGLGLKAKHTVVDEPNSKHDLEHTNDTEVPW